MIWDMETKKAWDPLTYIPYVVSQARSWDRTALRDGTTRFYRSSLQRGWITSEEGRVLEDVFVSDPKQTIYFLGRPRMVEENGKALVASSFQPLSCPTRCWWVGARTFEPVEHRYSDGCAGSSLLRAF